MAVVFRYVDDTGFVKESFVGIVHVANTSASSLKLAIDSLLCEHKLSASRIHE